MDLCMNFGQFQAPIHKYGRWQTWHTNIQSLLPPPGEIWHPFGAWPSKRPQYKCQFCVPNVVGERCGVSTTIHCIYDTGAQGVVVGTWCPPHWEHTFLRNLTIHHLLLVRLANTWISWGSSSSPYGFKFGEERNKNDSNVGTYVIYGVVSFLNWFESACNLIIDIAKPP